MISPPATHNKHICGATGTTFDLSHLNTFSVVVHGKGRKKGDDLKISVLFSNHVYSERIKHHQDPFDFMDHNSSKRVFDVDRYETSKLLPGTIQNTIEKNELVKKSSSYGGGDNLIFFRDFQSLPWITVFCFYPSEIDSELFLHVLSTHQREGRKNNKWEHIHSSARTCLFSEERYPKFK